MTLDIHSIMRGLAEAYQIFTEERDVQESLAKHITKSLGYETCLEFHSFCGESKRQDIWVPEADTLIELKYPTAKLAVESQGRKFSLKGHSAQDVARYRFVKDIQRLERAVEEGIYAKHGFAVMLTNDPLYWDVRRMQRGSNDAEFRIHDGRILEGEPSWKDPNLATPKDVGEEPIKLNGSYVLRWQEYSDFPGEKNGKFRYLAVSVGD